ncbi:NUDIX hydrolase [Rheinheimera sp.]|uniref:NUDIX hydrolase n=1 Tax=Rheinheimera sp. TaxID=1869214 RepID=UPI0040486057
MYGPFSPILVTSFFTLEEAKPILDSKKDPYYRVTGQDSVICCVLDQSDQFVMVRQYRPNLEAFTIESPAGGIERNENPLEAIKREIDEEAGLRCSLLPLGKNFNLMMNRTNINDHLFLGLFPETIPDFVPEPGLEILRIPRPDLLQYAMQGEYRQLAALGLLQLAGGILKVDFWHDTLESIENAFRQNPKVHWHGHG